MTNKEYQKEYWIRNPDKYQAMLANARKLKRNQKNRKNCNLSNKEINDCPIPKTVGINYKSCKCLMHCNHYKGERDFPC